MGTRATVNGAVLIALLVAAGCSDRAAGEAKHDADAAVDAGRVAADKMGKAAEATGAAITDGWITTKLKAKFADEVMLKDNDITVETRDHAVTLTGTVPSAAARARAVEIATGTEGVKEVVNHLVVK